MSVHLYADVNEIAENTFTWRFVLQSGEHQKEQGGAFSNVNKWQAINLALKFGLNLLKRPVPLTIHTDIADEGSYFSVKNEESYKILPKVVWVCEKSPYPAFTKQELGLNEEPCQTIDRGDFYEIIEPAA